MKAFIIVRHGNTFAADEEPRRIGARTDLPLVETGMTQAERLGRLFAARGWQFDRILSSPLRRTRATADVIRAALHDAPVCEPSLLLAEIDHGIDEGRPEAAVLARIGEAALREWDRSGEAPPGWQVDRAGRIAGWQALFAAPGGERVLLVTSNGAARFALLADPALTMQARALPSMKLRTGAFGVLRAGDRGWRVETWDERP